MDVSTAMSLTRVQQQVSVSMLEKAMDMEQLAMETLLEGLDAAGGGTASFGHQLDVLA